MDIRTIARFWSYVDKRGPDECWHWTGYKGKTGYGRMMVRADGRGRLWLVHRLAWWLEHGTPPPGSLCTCHRCDNPACCNPAHLFLGTPADNARDRTLKGRSGRAGDWARGERHSRAKVSDPDLAEIIRLRGQVPRAELAERYGVTPDSIARHWISGGRRDASRRPYRERPPPFGPSTPKRLLAAVEEP